MHEHDELVRRRGDHRPPRPARARRGRRPEVTGGARRRRPRSVTRPARSPRPRCTALVAGDDARHAPDEHLSPPPPRTAGRGRPRAGARSPRSAAARRSPPPRRPPAPTEAVEQLGRPRPDPRLERGDRPGVNARAASRRKRVWSGGSIVRMTCSRSLNASWSFTCSKSRTCGGFELKRGSRSTSAHSWWRATSHSWGPKGRPAPRSSAKRASGSSGPIASAMTSGSRSLGYHWYSHTYGIQIPSGMSSPAPVQQEEPGMVPERLTREERKARTRAQLLEAAGDLFRRQGFAATSLEQVAAGGRPHEGGGVRALLEQGRAVPVLRRRVRPAGRPRRAQPTRAHLRGALPRASAARSRR